VSTYDDARAAWGFPRFAKEFPRETELDRLVIAFTYGDYGTVREGAPRLAKATEDDAVKAAAERLLAATIPDPTSKVLFLLTAALLAFLTIYWMTHDHAPPGHSAPATPPTVEFPNGR
jgi:hypothetical protein